MPDPTTPLDLSAWCHTTAERFRDMEEHELAMYPSPDARDAALVEWVVRVLGNPQLPESAAVVATLAGRHGAAGEIAELTRERDQARAELAELVALGPEVTARRTVARELDRLAADPRLTRAWMERHSLASYAATGVGAVLRAVAADVGRGEVHGRRERWVVDGLVGSWVCAEPDPAGPDGICGMPVEDVPCTIHHPDGAQ